MKKRRSIIIAFLLVAAITLGVGYATLTDVLDVKGTTNVNQTAAEESFNTDVYFKSAVANREADGDVAEVTQADNDVATCTVNSLKGKGDTTTFTFTIANVGDLDATVTPKIMNNSHAEYFAISSDWAGAAKEIAAGTTEAPTTLTYTITVELLKTPTETIGGSFLIQLTATSEGSTTSGT